MRTRFAWIMVLAAGTAVADTHITIYNQNFAVVKEHREFELARGENEVRVTDITAHLEPTSVILRDLRSPGALRILEQNYESDPLSQGLLLSKSEGSEVDFEITLPNGRRETIRGRILRSGYVPHRTAYVRFGSQYAYAQQLRANPQGGGQPIVEVDGKIVFGLPGKPIFDGLDPEAFLKPTLLWRVSAADGGTREVEFSYVTGGMRWEATYNAIASTKDDRFDITGWVTLENMSGKDFDDARVKLMAGDVARVQPDRQIGGHLMGARTAYRAAPPVTERTFDEYHLYTLERNTTLLDRELKQVEFLRANGVPGRRLYVYDGAVIDDRSRAQNVFYNRNHADYGTQSNPKVWTMIEFDNDEASGLGMPLPKGVIKLYRRDETDGQNEFIGEDDLDHTPKDETVRLYIGNAFDIVGERRRTDYQRGDDEVFESFEINVRNHKEVEVAVRVVEHLYRWLQWELTTQSLASITADAQTVEFRPTIAAGSEVTITYTVHYTW